MINNIGGGR